AAYLIGHRRQCRDGVPEPLEILRGPDVADPHAEEFLARVAVLRDRGGVDLEEGERLYVIDPQGERIVGEQQSEARLALPERRFGLTERRGALIGPHARAKLGPRHAEKRTAAGQADGADDEGSDPGSGSER